jgi:ATP-dependent DNA helicase RecG
MKKHIFKGMSSRARLLLARREGLDAEFKVQLNGLDVEDLVAFANSRAGGTILVGVAEASDNHRVQRVEIVGCDVGDKEKQYILNKAQSCNPPIDLELYVENLGDKPFFRIEIPSGLEKPYCTSGGAYKVRGDGRTNALLPRQLLSIFMDTERDKFLSRFKDATKELEEEVQYIKDQLSSAIAEVYNNIRKTELARKANK